MPKLRSRWRTSEGIALAQQVRSAFSAGDGLSRVGLGRIDGRLDLRGYDDPGAGPTDLQVPVPGTDRSVTLRQRPVPAIIAGNLDSVDLSGARLGSFGFRAVSARDCLFDQGDCREIVISASVFENCSFRGANLTGASLGSYSWEQPRTIFEHVDFSGSRIVNAVSVNATYRDSAFYDVVIRKTDFSSSFIGCSFSGVIDEVEFRGPDTRGPNRPTNEFKAIDMRGAQLRYVRFAKIDLSPVLLPDRDHIVIANASCVLPTAIARLEQAGEPSRRGLLGLLEDNLKWLAGEIFVLYRFDGAASEADARWNEALLRAIEQECAAKGH